MSRSLKKPPFIHYKVMKRVDEAQASKSKAVIKTWSRASTITPDFVGLTFAVHNGNKFIPVEPFAIALILPFASIVIFVFVYVPAVAPV